MYTGKSIKRVDAYDKVTGRTRYTDDLCDKGAYVAKILHSTIAHGKVLSIETSEAEKVEGVVRILTCFDLKETLSGNGKEKGSTAIKCDGRSDRR